MGFIPRAAYHVAGRRVTVPLVSDEGTVHELTERVQRRMTPRQREIFKPKWTEAEKAAMDDLVNRQGLSSPEALRLLRAGHGGLDGERFKGATRHAIYNVARKMEQEREASQPIEQAINDPLRVAGEQAATALTMTKVEIDGLRRSQVKSTKPLSKDQVSRLRELVGVLKDTTALVKALPPGKVPDGTDPDGEPPASDAASEALAELDA